MAAFPPHAVTAPFRSSDGPNSAPQQRDNQPSCYLRLWSPDTLCRIIRIIAWFGQDYWGTSPARAAVAARGRRAASLSLPTCRIGAASRSTSRSRTPAISGVQWLDDARAPLRGHSQRRALVWTALQTRDRKRMNPAVPPDERSIDRECCFGIQGHRGHFMEAKCLRTHDFLPPLYSCRLPSVRRNERSGRDQARIARRSRIVHRRAGKQAQ